MDIKLLIITVALVITICFFLVNIILSKVFKARNIIYKCKFTKNNRVVLKYYAIILLGIPFIIAGITMIIKGKVIITLGFLIIWCDLVLIAFYNMNTRTVLTSKGIGKITIGGLVSIKNLYWDNIKSYEWNNNLLMLNCIMENTLGTETVNIPIEDKEKVDGILKEKFLT